MRTPLRRSALASAAFAAASAACLALAALPPGYGGLLRIAASGPIALPHPSLRETSFEAALSAAVYDRLGDIVDVEVEGDIARLRFHEGVVRHDRRPLRISDLQRSLRRLDRTNARHWLAPIARQGANLHLSIEGDSLVIHLRQEGVNVARWLRAAPLSLVIAPGTGTGAFRPRVTRSELRLFQFRSTGRGAPYLQRVQVSAHADREAELRSLMLGQLDASWSGATLYDTTPPHPMARHSLRGSAAVLLVASGSRIGELAHLGAVLDRRRLARVGLTPADHLADLPAPNLPARSAPVGGRSLAYRAGDVFAASLAQAMAARFDEEGWSIRPRAIPAAQWRTSAHRFDYRIAQVVPALDGAPILLAEAFAETGDVASAGALVRSALRAGDALDIRAEAGRLPALVLGSRATTLHLDADLRGLDNRELRLDRLHWRRSRTEAPR